MLLYIIQFLFYSYYDTVCCPVQCILLRSSCNVQYMSNVGHGRGHCIFHVEYRTISQFLTDFLLIIDNDVLYCKAAYSIFPHL